MKILVDTSIWSLAIRRKNVSLNEKEIELIHELSELINETRAIIVGPIRQEILSGVSHLNQFTILHDKLAAFENFPIIDNDYVVAAQFYNLCKSNGIQGSHIDFLICAIASNNNMPIFTIDNDFLNYSKYCKIKLYNCRKKK